MIATDIEERLSEAAKERQVATRLNGRNGEGRPVFGGGNNSTTEGDKGKARDQAAEITGTNENDKLTMFRNLV